jgi:hypothetical protein
MEKLVINFRQQDFENTVRKMNQAAKLVSKLLHAYDRFQDDTEIQNLDKASLLKVLGGQRGEIEKMIGAYVSEQKKPLANYYQEACYKALSKHLDPVFRELEIWRDQAVRDGVPAHLHDAGDWPIDEGLELEISEAFLESLKPHFELVIESETDRGLWERLKALEVAHNEFFAYAAQKEVRVPNGFNALFGVNQIFPQAEVKAVPGKVIPARSIHWRPR